MPGLRSEGLTLTYRLAHAGQLHLTLERSSAHGWVPIGAQTIAASAGWHTLALGGELTARRLRSGRYRLVVQSQRGKTRSKPVTLQFAVVARAVAGWPCTPSRFSVCGNPVFASDVERMFLADFSWIELIYEAVLLEDQTARRNVTLFNRLRDDAGLRAGDLPR